MHNWKLWVGLAIIVAGLFAFLHPYYNVVVWTFLLGLAVILWYFYDKKKEGVWSGLKSIFRRN